MTRSALAHAIGIASPTVSAWFGTDSREPLKSIRAEHMFDACKTLGVRIEWVLYGIGDMREAPVTWPFAFTLEQYLSLSEPDRREIEALIHLRIVQAAQKPSDFA
ncbi:hypothetical protein 8G_00060 [Ralstonia phage Hyacinthe]|uniref:HTH cro/C1-type domain-containing protein n=3 Tax=Rahariannevirus raharianne TaxID=2846050 RepID=A0A7G5BB98_9CAUD|nr:hypothetical protein KMC43_gp02 [Ralstonia phage Raharianne]QMV32377.1 hypothetical protein U2_00002 [Ralstonia phage Albius]QMV33492.1 hypothetical protein 8G_00060 [Ralstonia phage Hyacinthe]QMV33571.1 hypothetical protein Y2_00002 [Ralstonia phage Raharianne]